MLDEVDPQSLQPCFDDAVGVLDANGGLDEFKRLDGRILIALDGTEYFSSKKIKCSHCLHRKRRNGTVDYYHSMLCATVVAPGQTQCLQLMPEFIENFDGNDKQDCERNAAKRWLTSDKATSISKLRPVFLGDALFACQPMAETIADIDGADFIFVVKPDFHKAIFDFVESSAVQKFEVAGPKGSTHTYRFVRDVPIRENDPVYVDWCEFTIADKSGTVTYCNSFVTSLSINAGNVIEIVACGRTRWKIENESFNVLKNHGYNLAHNFGHGNNHLAKVLGALNLLAFNFHNICDVLEDLWKRARKKAGKRTSFFNTLFHTCDIFIFETWQELFDFILIRKPPASLRALAGGP